ncbi:MAG TPA: hypothetical protein VJ111_02245, partial [Chitinophagaceae bacterium]|nr:hypothetical protein [Chitinophagaceae bacterium]
MKNKNIYEPGFSFSWHRLLRRSVHRSVLSSTEASQFTQSETKDRTLVRSVRYSATHPYPSREGIQTHSPRFSKMLINYLLFFYRRGLKIFRNLKLSDSKAPFRGFGGLLGGFLLLFLCLNASAQQSTWIWYPGDYEIWLSN